MAATATYMKARFMSLATQRAQLELEKADALGYDDLIKSSLISDSIYPSSEYTALTSEHGVSFTEDSLVGGKGKVVVTALNDKDNHPTLLRVDIEVTWDGTPRAQSNVRLSTYLVKKPKSSGTGGRFFSWNCRNSSSVRCKAGFSRRSRPMVEIVFPSIPRPQTDPA
jgi:hypothetical protein